MKKIIVAIAFLLIITGVCAPFVNGLVMEKIVQKSQVDLNKMYAEDGSGVTVDILEYNRKFSTSEIKWRIRLGNLAPFYGVDEIILIDRAKHGFTGVASETSLEQNPWFIDIINNKLNGANPFHITTTYKLSGTIDSRVDFDAFSFQTGGETVAVQPGQVTVTLGKGLTHLSSEATWEGLSVSDEFRINGFSQTYDLTKISSAIWAGEISFEVAEMTVRDQKDTLELVHFKGTYSLDFDKKTNRLATWGTAAFDTLITSNGKTQDGFIKLGAYNIDATGYEELMKYSSQTTSSFMNSINTADANPEAMSAALEQQMAASGLQMIAASEKILKKGLKVTVADLHARRPAGEITGNMEILLNQDVTLAQLFPIAMDPNLAFDIISLQSNLSFPAEIINDTTMLTSPIFQGMQTGLFVRNGENLVHSTQTRNGRLILNGSEVLFN